MLFQRWSVHLSARICNLEKFRRRISRSVAPVIHVPDQSVLVDKRIEIKVSHLRPFQKVTLRMEVESQKKIAEVFESYGHFISDMQGTVNAANDASFGGTYKGIDGMGLFWSMLQVPGQRKGIRFITRDVTRPMEFKVSLFDGHVMSDGKASSPKEATAKLPMPLANATILRTYLSENVERREISVGRMRGTLFVPKGIGRFPGVIDMFGSDGGLKEFRAALLASHGFVVLALAFYAYKDLPDNLGNVELEYFIEAAQWVAKHEKVYQNGIGFLGVSYGAQIALQVAAECPMISAAVGISPLHCIYFSIMHKGKRIGLSRGPDPNRHMRGDTLFTRDFVVYESDEFKRVELEVEKIEGKVLLIAGMDDTAENSVENSNRMEARLALHRRPPSQRLDYPGTGHLIDIPYMPTCDMCFDKTVKVYWQWGGTAETHSAAQEHSWKAIRDFFRENINKKK